MQELQTAFAHDMARIRYMVSKNPATAYSAIVEIGKQVGSKYKVHVIVNFPHQDKILEFDMYGRRDISVIIDKQRRNFPIPREDIKAKARDIFGDITVEDAYMYEDKEGARVWTPNGKIDILPHSLHIWTIFDEKVSEYCDWLAENVYWNR